jgi:calcineurin-like phosphoesterase
MTGPHDGIIGMEREPSLARFLNGMPSRFEPATGNPRLNGVIVDADDKTGRAVAVQRISYSEQELTHLEAGAGRDLQTSSPRPPALSEPVGRVEG